MVLSFGKYKGKTLQDVPKRYLHYLIGLKNDDLSEAALAEWAQRRKWGDAADGASPDRMVLRNLGKKKK